LKKLLTFLSLPVSLWLLGLSRKARGGRDVEILLILLFSYNFMASFIRENIRISLGAIRSQLLRTILTVLIISFGIMALVGILTAIDAIKSSINSNFTSMGANTFTIRNREMSVHIGRNGKRPKHFRSITYDEAVRFTREYSFPAKPSVSTFASGGSTIKFQSKKTNPNMRVFGADENYIFTSGYELDRGRNFSAP